MVWYYFTNIQTNVFDFLSNILGLHLSSCKIHFDKLIAEVKQQICNQKLIAVENFTESFIIRLSDLYCNYGNEMFNDLVF